MRVLLLVVIILLVYLIVGAINILWMWNELTEELDDCSTFDFYYSIAITMVIFTPYNVYKRLTHFFNDKES